MPDNAYQTDYLLRLEVDPSEALKMIETIEQRFKSLDLSNVNNSLIALQRKVSAVEKQTQAFNKELSATVRRVKQLKMPRVDTKPIKEATESMKKHKEVLAELDDQSKASAEAITRPSRVFEQIAKTIKAQAPAIKKEAQEISKAWKEIFGGEAAAMPLDLQKWSRSIEVPLENGKKAIYGISYAYDEGRKSIYAYVNALNDVAKGIQGIPTKLEVAKSTLKSFNETLRYDSGAVFTKVSDSIKKALPEIEKQAQQIAEIWKTTMGAGADQTPMDLQKWTRDISVALDEQHTAIFRVSYAYDNATQSIKAYVTAQNDVAKSLDGIPQRLELTRKAVDDTATTLNYDAQQLFGQISSAIQKDIPQIESQAQQIAKAWKAAFGPDVKKIPMDFQKWTKDISIALDDQHEAVFRVTYTYDEATKSVKAYATAQNDIAKSLDGIPQKFQIANEKSGNFVSTLKNVQSTFVALKKVATWGIATTAIYGSARVFKSYLSIMTELQTKLVDIQKVLSETEDIEHYWGLGIALATKYKVAAGEALDIMLNFARQGFRGEELAQATEATLLAMQATTLSVEESSRTLIALTRQFKLSAEDYAKTIDKIAKVSSTFAITSNELADAITKIGTVAQATNADLDDFIGLITAAVEATRKSGREIGTAWRTIIGRMYGRETAQTALSSLIGVSKEEYLSMGVMDVLSAIADKWDQLSESEQRAIAVAAGGTRRYTDFLAVMQNFDRVTEAAASSMTALGEAQRMAELRLNTYAAALQGFKTRLTAAFEGVGSALLRSLTEALEPGRLAILIGVPLAAGLTQKLIPIISKAVAEGTSTLSAIGSFLGKGLLSPWAIGAGAAGIIMLIYNQIQKIKQLNEHYERLSREVKKVTNTYYTYKQRLDAATEGTEKATWETKKLATAVKDAEEKLTEMFPWLMKISSFEGTISFEIDENSVKVIEDFFGSVENQIVELGNKIGEKLSEVVEKTIPESLPEAAWWKFRPDFSKLIVPQEQIGKKTLPKNFAGWANYVKGRTPAEISDFFAGMTKGLDESLKMWQGVLKEYQKISKLAAIIRQKSTKTKEEEEFLSLYDKAKIDERITKITGFVESYRKFEETLFSLATDITNINLEPISSKEKTKKLEAAFADASFKLSTKYNTMKSLAENFSKLEDMTAPYFDKLVELKDSLSISNLPSMDFEGELETINSLTDFLDNLIQTAKATNVTTEKFSEILAAAEKATLKRFAGEKYTLKNIKATIELYVDKLSSQGADVLYDQLKEIYGDTSWVLLEKTIKLLSTLGDEILPPDLKNAIKAKVETMAGIEGAAVEYIKEQIQSLIKEGLSFDEAFNKIFSATEFKSLFEKGFRGKTPELIKQELKSSLQTTVKGKIDYIKSFSTVLNNIGILAANEVEALLNLTQTQKGSKEWQNEVLQLENKINERKRQLEYFKTYVGVKTSALQQTLDDSLETSVDSLDSINNTLGIINDYVNVTNKTIDEIVKNAPAKEQSLYRALLVKEFGIDERGTYTSKIKQLQAKREELLKQQYDNFNEALSSLTLPQDIIAGINENLLSLRSRTINQTQAIKFSNELPAEVANIVNILKRVAGSLSVPEIGRAIQEAQQIAVDPEALAKLTEEDLKRFKELIDITNNWQNTVVDYLFKGTNTTDVNELQTRLQILLASRINMPEATEITTKLIDQIIAKFGDLNNQANELSSLLSEVGKGKLKETYIDDIKEVVNTLGILKGKVKRGAISAQDIRLIGEIFSKFAYLRDNIEALKNEGALLESTLSNMPKALEDIFAGIGDILGGGKTFILKGQVVKFTADKLYEIQKAIATGTVDTVTYLSDDVIDYIKRLTPQQRAFVSNWIAQKIGVEVLKINENIAETVQSEMYGQFTDSIRKLEGYRALTGTQGIDTTNLTKAINQTYLSLKKALLDSLIELSSNFGKYGLKERQAEIQRLIDTISAMPLELPKATEDAERVMQNLIDLSKTINSYQSDLSRGRYATESLKQRLNLNSLIKDLPKEGFERRKAAEDLKNQILAEIKKAQNITDSIVRGMVIKQLQDTLESLDNIITAYDEGLQDNTWSDLKQTLADLPAAKGTEVEAGLRDKARSKIVSLIESIRSWRERLNSVAEYGVKGTEDLANKLLDYEGKLEKALDNPNLLTPQDIDNMTVATKEAEIAIAKIGDVSKEFSSLINPYIEALNSNSLETAEDVNNYIETLNELITTIKNSKFAGSAQAQKTIKDAEQKVVQESAKLYNTLNSLIEQETYASFSNQIKAIESFRAKYKGLPGREGDVQQYEQILLDALRRSMADVQTNLVSKLVSAYRTGVAAGLPEADLQDITNLLNEVQKFKIPMSNDINAIKKAVKLLVSLEKRVGDLSSEFSKIDNEVQAWLAKKSKLPLELLKRQIELSTSVLDRTTLAAQGLKEVSELKKLAQDITNSALRNAILFTLNSYQRYLQDIFSSTKEEPLAAIDLLEVKLEALTTKENGEKAFASTEDSLTFAKEFNNTYRKFVEPLKNVLNTYKTIIGEDKAQKIRGILTIFEKYYLYTEEEVQKEIEEWHYVPKFLRRFLYQKIKNSLKKFKELQQKIEDELGFDPFDPQAIEFLESIKKRLDSLPKFITDELIEIKDEYMQKFIDYNKKINNKDFKLSQEALRKLREGQIAISKQFLKDTMSILDSMEKAIESSPFKNNPAAEEVIEQIKKINALRDSISSDLSAGILNQNTLKALGDYILELENLKNMLTKYPELKSVVEGTGFLSQKEGAGYSTGSAKEYTFNYKQELEKAYAAIQSDWVSDILDGVVQFAENSLNLTSRFLSRLTSAASQAVGAYLENLELEKELKQYEKNSTEWVRVKSAIDQNKVEMDKALLEVGVSLTASLGELLAEQLKGGPAGEKGVAIGSGLGAMIGFTFGGNIGAYIGSFAGAILGGLVDNTEAIDTNTEAIRELTRTMRDFQTKTFALPDTYYIYGANLQRGYA